MLGVDPAVTASIGLPMQHEPTSKAEGEEQLPSGDSVVEEVVGEEADARVEAAAEVVVEEVPRTPEEQLAEWKDRAIRSAADLDNFRKRMAREKSESLRYGNQALLEELLPVLDNFEMGLQAAASDSESMIFRGMAMVKKQLDDFLASQGVTEIPAEGQVFDPNVHEAVVQEECPDAEEGAILRVTRRGYRMNDRLLRPATVVVAKSPAESDSSEEEGDQE